MRIVLHANSDAVSLVQLFTFLNTRSSSVTQSFSYLIRIRYEAAVCSAVLIAQLIYYASYVSKM